MKAQPSTTRDIIKGLGLTLTSNILLYLGHLLIARRLPREDYATFTVIVSFVSLMALFADLGLTLLFVRKFAAAEALVIEGKHDSRGELLGTMLILRFSMAVLVSIIVMLITPILGYTIATRHLMMIMLVTLFISSRLFVVRSVGEAFLRGQNKYHLVALFAGVDALTFALVLYFYAGKILDLEGAVWIYSFCHIPGFLLLIGLIYKDTRSVAFRLSFRFLALRAMLREGLPLIFSTAFLTIHNTADALLLDKLSTPKEVSALGAGLRVLSAIIFLPTVFSAIIGPLVTQAGISKQLTQIRSTIDRSLRILFIIGVLIAISLTAAPNIFMGLLFGGNKYTDAAPLVVIFGWTFIPIAFATFMTEIAIAEGRLWMSTIYMGFIMIVSVSSDLLLIPHYGAFGVGMAKCIAVSGGAILLFLISNKLDVLDKEKFVLFFIKIIGCVGFALSIIYFSKIIQVGEVFTALIACCGFSTFVMFLRVITTKEIAIFFSGVFNRSKIINS